MNETYRHEESKNLLNSGNAWDNLVQNILPLKIKKLDNFNQFRK